MKLGFFARIQGVVVAGVKVWNCKKAWRDHGVFLSVEGSSREPEDGEKKRGSLSRRADEAHHYARWCVRRASVDPLHWTPHR